MKKTFFAISLLFLTYVILRAICVPFTHDEAFTYLDIASLPLANIVTATPPIANNHILNTLLVKFIACFSSSELALRLPNILAFCIYLYAAAKLSLLLFEEKLVQVCLFIALAANASLLEFFALSRGYGIAIGLLLYSVYQLILSFQIKDPKYSVHACLVAAVLAVYANFGVLPAALGIFIGIAVRQYSYYKRLVQALALPVLYGIAMLLLCAYPIKKLIDAHELYYGGEKNFIEDTLYTLLHDTMGESLRITTYKYMMLLVCIVLILFCIVTAISKVFSRKRCTHQQLLVAPLLLLFCLICINLQFYISGTKLVIHRTALYLYPLIVLSIFSALQIGGKSRKFKQVFTTVFTTLLLIALIYNANLSIATQWDYDAYSKNVVAFAAEHKPSDRKVKMLTHWLMSRSVNYYIQTRHGKDVAPTPFSQQDLDAMNIGDYDYVYVRAKDKGEISKYPKFRVVQAYKDSSFLLYQKAQETAVPQ